MKPYHYHILRLVTALVSIWLASIESPWWPAAVLPWAVLCVFGLIATIPIVLVIGAGVGAAQADWISDEFVIGVVIVLPTLLAIIVADVFGRWSGRRKQLFNRTEQEG